MVDYKYGELFQRDSTEKQILIETEDKSVIITNTELHNQQFELKESLCSEKELRFGSCEASSVKFKISNIFTSLKGKWLTISVVLDGHSEEPFQIGIYKVYSDVPTADRRYRDVVAYDALRDIINSDASNWYNTILPNADSSITMKEFRKSFLLHFGIEQEDKELVNDGMIIKKTIEPSGISGKDVLNAICEINGCFGHIGRNGKFQYILLRKYTQGLYPANDIYPANNLYPRESTAITISKSRYISCSYEDYLSQKIKRLQIRKEENDIGSIYPDGEAVENENTYVVEDNFLVYGKTADDLKKITKNLYSVISDTEYRPFSASVLGNPCFEVGDPVKFNTKYDIVESYILERTLKGIQALNDSFTAEGEEKFSGKVNSVQRSIVQLKNRTNILTRDVDKTVSQLSDLEKDTASKFEQTNEKIELKVSKGDVSAQISVETGGVDIRGNRISIQSDNFNLSKTGEVDATGKFTSKTTDDSGNNYESILGDAGLRIRRNGEETGRVSTGSAGSERGIAVQSYGTVVITNGTTIGYIFNPNGTIQYEQRNILQGGTRANGEFILKQLTFSDESAYLYGVSYEGGGSVASSGGFYANGSIGCSGTKYRVVETDTYGNVGMNALETPAAFFADIGSGVIGKYGKCYIFKEDVFSETIDEKHEIYIQITATNGKNARLKEKNNDFFVVEGDEGAEFDWIIFAKQKGYQSNRAERVTIPNTEIQYNDNIFVNDETAAHISESYMEDIMVDYDKMADDYLKKYYEEVLSI